jgi:FkbH-like protein
VPDDKHKARVHQLFTKTNQFNLTTIRYSPSDIQRFIKDAEWDIRITHVKDKFGELGIVGLYLVNNEKTVARIDSFILSCRAMGRGIETAMMNKIKEDYLVSERYDGVVASYLPTAKNKPVTEFYETEGFDVVSEESSGEKKYIITRQQAELRECVGINIRSV